MTPSNCVVYWKAPLPDWRPNDLSTSANGDTASDQLEIMTLIRRARMTMETFNRYIDLNAHSMRLLDLSHSRMFRRAIQQACSLPFASPSAFLKRQYVSSDTRELYLISADQHCGIVDAIQNREGMRAEILTREHARVARRNLEDALRNSELPADLAGAKLIEFCSA